MGFAKVGVTRYGGTSESWEFCFGSPYDIGCSIMGSRQGPVMYVNFHIPSKYCSPRNTVVLCIGTLKP